MNTLNDLRASRARIWEEAKAFLDARRDENGILSEEDSHRKDLCKKDFSNK